jgi:uncharacterized protein YwgA
LRSPMGRSALILSALRAVDPFQGRTKVQKILYLANLCGWNTIDDYRYYNFGPYSDTVASELENFGKNSWVEERPFETRDSRLSYAYHLTPQGRKVADSLAAKVDDPSLIKRTMSLVKSLHNFSSDDLEIMATLVFMRRIEAKISDDELVDIVRELKPKFNRDRIAQDMKIFSVLKDFRYA